MKSLYSNILLTVSIIILSLQITQSQTLNEKTVVKGKVVDEATGQGIAFATVSVKGNYLGTVTNLDGEFNLNIPASLTSDTLAISYVGYDSHQILIRTISRVSTIEVKLTEKVIELEEVLITTERLSADEIIRRTVQNLGETYSTKPFLMRGHFREIREQNFRSSYLVEAAVSVYDPGLALRTEGNKKERRDLFVRDMRASGNYLNELITPALDGHNFLHFTLENNWLKAFSQIVSNPKVEKKLVETTYKDNKPLHVVSLAGISKMADNDPEYKDLRYEARYLVYIDAETYAVHKVEYIEKPLEGVYTGIEPPYEGDTLYYSKKGWKVSREYEEHNGKMYLRYINQTYLFDIYNRKAENVYLDLNFNMTFVRTDIELENVKRPKLKKVSRNKSLMLQTRKYSTGFWNESVDALMVPLTGKQISDLERDKTLEEQFVVNGRHRD